MLAAAVLVFVVFVLTGSALCFSALGPVYIVLRQCRLFCYFGVAIISVLAVACAGWRQFVGAGCGVVVFAGVPAGWGSCLVQIQKRLCPSGRVGEILLLH